MKMNLKQLEVVYICSLQLWPNNCLLCPSSYFSSFHSSLLPSSFLPQRNPPPTSNGRPFDVDTPVRPRTTRKGSLLAGPGRRDGEYAVEPGSDAAYWEWGERSERESCGEWREWCAGRGTRGWREERESWSEWCEQVARDGEAEGSR